MRTLLLWWRKETQTVQRPVNANVAKVDRLVSITFYISEHLGNSIKDPRTLGVCVYVRHPNAGGSLSRRFLQPKATNLRMSNATFFWKTARQCCVCLLYRFWGSLLFVVRSMLQLRIKSATLRFHTQDQRGYKYMLASWDKTSLILAFGRATDKQRVRKDAESPEFGVSIVRFWRRVNWKITHLYSGDLERTGIITVVKSRNPKLKSVWFAGNDIL